MSRILEVFVSSPGDLAEERRAVAEMVGQLALAPHIHRRGYTLRAHLYEEIVPPVLADGPGAAIDTFMLDPARCDVLVCLLGDRLGTKMRDPREPTETWISGTVYETTAAHESTRSPQPQVLIYYRRTPRAAAIPADRRAVEDFVAEIVSVKGRVSGIAPATFEDSRDLVTKLKDHLDAIVTYQMGRYEALRRRRVLTGALAALALAAAGYEGSRYLADSAYEKGRSNEAARDLEFIASAVARGPIEALGRLNVWDCGAVPIVMTALVAQQPVGDLPTIEAAIHVLQSLASNNGPACGCDELLGVLRTRDPPTRYCQSTHLLALAALQDVPCAEKERVVREYLGKIKAGDSFKNVFCKQEVAKELGPLEAAARDVLSGPKTSDLGGQQQ